MLAFRNAGYIGAAQILSACVAGLVMSRLVDMRGKRGLTRKVGRLQRVLGVGCADILTHAAHTRARTRMRNPKVHEKYICKRT